MRLEEDNTRNVGFISNIHANIHHSFLLLWLFLNYSTHTFTATPPPAWRVSLNIPYTTFHSFLSAPPSLLPLFSSQIRSR